MLDARYLAAKFALAVPYGQYVLTGTPEQQRRWQQFHDVVQLTDAQRALIGGFGRDMKVLVVSGIWCGDCVEQCPILQKIAEASPRIDLRFVDRDQQKDLSDQVKICAGGRVPVVLFLAEDYEFCGLAGDRSLHRYRAIAARQLGASCPTGLVPPGQAEVALAVQEWADEFERIALMLRLSPRLRKLHGD
jgi:thiol-disulfide isomerase/thioredoxin